MTSTRVVLHLLDPEASGDAGVGAYAALAGSEDGVRHEAWVIGDSGASRRLPAMGIRVDRSLVPRRGMSGEWGGATWAMREAVRERFAAVRPDRPVAVVTWSARAVALLRDVVPAATPWVVVAGDPEWECRIAGGEGVLAALDRVPIVCGSETMRARWRPYREHFALDPRVLPIGGEVVDDAERLQHRQSLRRALGIDDERLVVTFLADAGPRGDSMWFVFFIGLLFVAGIPTVGLVPSGAGRTASIRRAARYTALHGRRWWLREVDAPLASMLAASDLCVRQGGERLQHGMPAVSSCDEAAVMLAASMGVPVVQDDEPLIGEVLGNAFVPPTRARGEVSGAAGTLITMARDPEMRRRLGANLQEMAHGRAERWPAAFAELLDERIGRPVVREGLPVPALMA